MIVVGERTAVGSAEHIESGNLVAWPRSPSRLFRSRPRFRCLPRPFPASAYWAGGKRRR